MALAAGLSTRPGQGHAEPSRLEREVLEELNAARTRPADYARQLQAYRDRFTGMIAHQVEGDIGVGTFEGPRAVDQAVDFVSRRRPIGPVDYDPALAKAAADHAQDQSHSGGFGHVGSDGSRPSQRIWRYARGRTLVAEIISYGQPTAESVIRQLVIDDGEAARPHRADVFDPALRHAGVACRSHPVYRYSCVIDLSGD
jgi:hypothetical protein